jgi:hypothetical protein
MSFYDEISKYNWSEVKDFIYSRKEPDVLNAINKNALSLQDDQNIYPYVCFK